MFLPRVFNANLLKRLSVVQYFQYCIYACVEGINILCIFVRYGVVERLKIRTSGEISAEAYLLSCKNNLIL